MRAPSKGCAVGLQLVRAKLETLVWKLRPARCSRTFII